MVAWLPGVPYLWVQVAKFLNELPRWVPNLYNKVIHLYFLVNLILAGY